MSVFAELTELGHEQVVFCRDDRVGLRAIIGIHSTALGPALGGCRLYNYATEGDALKDVLRLSRGMTYKAAVAGLDLGGGKGVIWGDPTTIKSEALFRSFGRFVDSLGGRYITAEDMNTTVEDMNWVHRETEWVTGHSPFSGGSGDPSPVTAWGTFHGIRACLEVVYGSPDVEGRTIAIQGVGSVGYHLAAFLHERGAKLLYNDISERKLARCVEEFGGKVMEDDEFWSAECDVLAPCAIGGVLNARTIPMIKAPIVAGAANNQLALEHQDGEALEKAGITYAPDYVINAGGIINVGCEFLKGGYDEKESLVRIERIPKALKELWTISKDKKIPPSEAADHLAERIVSEAKKAKTSKR